MVEGKVVDTVYTPKKAVPKDQDSKVIHNAPHRGASNPSSAASNTISAAQQNLLQQNGITYEVANGIWGIMYFLVILTSVPSLIRVTRM